MVLQKEGKWVNMDEEVGRVPGGNPNVSKKPMDQRLLRGNLALKTSMVAKLPIRVIHHWECFNKNNNGLKGSKGRHYKYVYDGLYFVASCQQERDDNGLLVFKF
ncbi:OLC1v1012708C1 [Oldenlandia corymbosa var. corymbosa]|uniref:OLC1v1012708C1 n=1 Tax=Oldenlandia corymbosa var. corymbosa TaxID=529605 RepID=A0AAV1DWL7_OLDCO|nr:OLC1v1012708C1 [Oldenlandia corymbosa var. corymbosa]